jgi:hypothetical protein
MASTLAPAVSSASTQSTAAISIAYCSAQRPSCQQRINMHINHKKYVKAHEYIRW